MPTSQPRAFAAALALALALVAVAPLAAAAQGTVPPARAMAGAPALAAIDRVWAGQSSRFALAVTDTMIFVAYYDANRQMTIASRPRGGIAWVYHKVDSWVGWDSHNYIALAVDAAGQLHVTGNMHADPLVYYRTRIPGDVRSLVRIPVMADAAAERSMTYPVFLTGAGGSLVFKYRDGRSGNGNEIYNVYQPATQRWSPLLRTPLTDGQGRRNAYFMGPVLGPDRLFHIAWVWRESPMAETNHDLSYARSVDLIHWTRSDGTPLTLPMTLASAEIIDPVPVKGGMINNNTIIGFDPAGRVMITYHKFDAAGNTQVYVARAEGKAGWHIAQVSDWRGFRWDFRGGGSLDSRLFVSGAVPVGRDRIRLSVIRDGKPIDFLLDVATLKRVSEAPGSSLAAQLATSLAVPQGMTLNTVEDAGSSGLALAWPTLPPHRDMASRDIPDATTLRLVSPGDR